MKILSIQRALLPTLLVCGLGLFSPIVENGRAQELTPDQLEEISAQLAAIRKVLSDQASSRNQNAADVFLAAAGSGKEALELYVKCYKEVNFDREGRKESDFRDWRDKQADRFREDAFIEGLRLQLRYLGLSCKAAEAEELSQVFGSLIAYVDSLSQLEEMPSKEAMQAINSTVFAQAYELDEQLAKNKSWEQVPYNISGIYEKTILPYLRKESPDRLANAWDKRIEQETRVVQFLEKEKEKQLKGSADDKRKTRDKQTERSKGNGGNGGNVLRTHDKEFFLRDTLPSLRWGKMVDMFSYGNRPKAALDMLVFIKENIKSPKAETWMNQFADLLSKAGAPREPTQPSSPPAPASAPTATPPGTTSTTSATSKSKAPPGFDQ
jgi:hypothetical protein